MSTSETAKAIPSTPRNDVDIRDVEEYFNPECSPIPVAKGSLLSLMRRKDMAEVSMGSSFHFKFYALKDKDDEIAKDFNPYALLKSEVSQEYRQKVYAQLVRIQFLSKTSNEVLHLASTFADRYLWTEPIKCDNFVLMACAAFWLALRTVTPEAPITPELVNLLCRGHFEMEEVENWGEHLRQVMGPDLEYPTLHTYLRKFMKKCRDFPPYYNKLFTIICYYLIDLGLMDYNLTRYPAYFRCSAIIYLLRRLLLSTGHVLGGTPSYHPFDMLELWPRDMARYTHCVESRDLYEVSLAYCMLLEEAKTYISREKKYAPHFLPIIAKYSSPEYGKIMTHPLLTKFNCRCTMHLDMLDLVTEEPRP